MVYFLLFAIGFLLINSAIIIRNHFDFRRIGTSKGNPTPAPNFLISVCIPARNEELVIRRCVESVLNQNYKNFEVLVLDDASVDGTFKILEMLARTKSGKLRVLEGIPRPDNWLGKPWACDQLADQAKGDIMLFVDADTWMEPDFLTQIAHEFSVNKLSALTVWPQQQVVGFWEKVVIPQVYYALTSLLPVRYSERDPRWLPSAFNSTARKAFAAGCGQCIAFTNICYYRIGGHAAVKSKIVEDVELAKMMRLNGLNYKMYRGDASIHCRMYTSENEILSGFRKNFLEGFSGNIPLFVLAGILHLIVFLLPLFALLFGLFTSNTTITLLSVSAILMVSLQRLYLDIRNKWNPVFGIFHFMGVLWFHRLAIISIIDKLTGRKTIWKGREIG